MPVGLKRSGNKLNIFYDSLRITAFILYAAVDYVNML